MNRLFPFLAFQPPSDMTGGSGSGGGTPGWLKWTGIGCGVVLIAIGIAFAMGAFKAVSCCGDMQDLGKRAMGANSYATDYVTTMQTSADEAYRLTTDGYKSRVSKEEFQKMVDENATALSAGVPQVGHVNVNQKNRDMSSPDAMKRFEYTVLVAPITGGDQTLVVNLVIMAQDTDPPSFLTDEIRMENKARRIQDEPPAKAVIDFHNDLQKDKIAFSYGRLSQSFQQNTDRETFKAFLEQTGEPLTNSKMDIKDLTYPGPNRATVMAETTTRSGQKTIIQYELEVSEMVGMRIWTIAAIAPTIMAVAPSEKTFEVVLETTGDKKIEVIKVIRASTEQKLSVTKALVENVPSVVKKGMSKEDADKLKTELETAGATATIE